MRILSLGALILAAMLLADTVSASDVRLPDAERIVLENGVVIILVEKHDVPLIGLEAVVRGGARIDPADKYGLANLLAGLMNKGAGPRNSGEFAEAAAGVGGTIAAGASLESLNISAEFMAADAALMVELVADMLQRPALSATEFEKLRARSINMIKAAKGSDPNRLLSAYANAFLFGAHPYGNPVSGSESSLENIQHADVLSYYEDQVGANRLVVAVSGDFLAEEMRTLLSDAFANWRPAAAALPEVATPAPVTDTRVFLIDKPGATQTYFRIGNVSVARSYPGRASLDLANTIFGGRFSSMLNTELRTKSGLGYGARAVLSRYEQPGALFITSYTATEKTVQAVDAALATLRQLHDSSIGSEMTDSARNYVMGSFPTRFETAGQLASIFATLESLGLDDSYISEYGGQLTTVTPESMATVIDEVYPTPDELVFVILGDAEAIRDQVAQYGPITDVSISEPRFHP